MNCYSLHLDLVYFNEMDFSHPKCSNKIFGDEASAASYKQLCKLLETLLAKSVSNEVHKLCKEKRCGCEYDHPSQRQHDCIMLTEEEKWVNYGLEAMEQVYSKRVIWRLFLEALRVLKLEYHSGIVDHLRDLEREPDSALVHSPPQRLFVGFGRIIADNTWRCGGYD